MAGKTTVNPTGSLKRTRSNRAGLQFPVARITRYLKRGNYADRVGAGAGVYLAAVLQYLASEVLEVSGNAAMDNKRKRIAPRHILLGFKNDHQLNQLIPTVTMPGAGIMPKLYAITSRVVKKHALFYNKFS